MSGFRHGSFLFTGKCCAFFSDRYDTISMEPV
nr:MAG TPA_asm: hypothetical protein [Caudoviricetes sp.]